MSHAFFNSLKHNILHLQSELRRGEIINAHDRAKYILENIEKEHKEFYKLELSKGKP